MFFFLFLFCLCLLALKILNENICLCLLSKSNKYKKNTQKTQNSWQHFGKESPFKTGQTGTLQPTAGIAMTAKTGKHTEKVVLPASSYQQGNKQNNTQKIANITPGNVDVIDMFSNPNLIDDIPLNTRDIYYQQKQHQYLQNQSNKMHNHNINNYKNSDDIMSEGMPNAYKPVSMPMYGNNNNNSNLFNVSQQTRNIGISTVSTQPSLPNSPMSPNQIILSPNKNNNNNNFNNAQVFSMADIENMANDSSSDEDQIAMANPNKNTNTNLNINNNNNNSNNKANVNVNVNANNNYQIAMNDVIVENRDPKLIIY